jgi:hypothetical protein
MIDFKAGLEKYIEAEIQRRVEERLAKVLRELGVLRAGLRRRGGGRTRASVTEAPASTPPKKPRQPVSAETRATMKAAWARRKAALEAPSAGGNVAASPARQ